MELYVARFVGPTWAHLGPTEPRWAPCCPHEPCHLEDYTPQSYGLIGCKTSKIDYIRWRYTFYMNSVYEQCMSIDTTETQGAGKQLKLKCTGPMAFITMLHVWTIRDVDINDNKLLRGMISDMSLLKRNLWMSESFLVIRKIITCWVGNFEAGILAQRKCPIWT